MRLDEARLRQVIEEAHARLADERDRRTEPIAIVGLACRFPGAADAGRFWDLLRQGVDATGDIPGDRWDIERYFDPDPASPGTMYVRRGGFLDDVAGFDAALFKIPPPEALRMDPQQRLLLETTWEALEDAGYDPRALAGVAAGVFVGACFDDYGRRTITSGQPQLIDPYSALGNTRSLTAGRIAYAFGLSGPALQLDTSCSSSLVALHLATHSLRSRECDVAIVAGVNVICAPETMISFCRMRALSADGRCRTFSAQASGYGRGEGCGVLILQRLSSARARGQVRAIVKGSAVNHDGRSNGLTAPNGLAQESVIQTALASAGVAASSVDYVEAHGTGTALGDPIEALALARAYATPQRVGVCAPLLVGSVKTNIGHLEGAAGVAGLIKVVLALEGGLLPQTLYSHPPSPRIDFAGLGLRACDPPVEWLRRDTARRAGVSAFGMSGTNAHVIVEEAPADLAVSHRPPARTTFSRQRYWLDWPAPASPPGPTGIRPVAQKVSNGGDPLADALARIRGVLLRVAGADEAAGNLERPLSDLGVDSLMVVEFEAALRDEGVQISVSSEDTPMAIARRLAFPAIASEPDLASEARLPDDIRPLPGDAPLMPSELLLTGATGFLGAFLLHELLERTAARIHCLVRASDTDAARERLAANLDRYGLWSPRFAPRINALPGSLEAPRLGLSSRDYERLAVRADAIISSGAQVSYLAGFDQMRASHVSGALGLLRLACEGTPKRIHHVSSIAVWESSRYAGMRVQEDTEPVAYEGIVLPYSQCKWVSDALMREAAKRGIPVTLHRPSLIGGHSVTGAWNDGDILRRFLATIAESRLFPANVGLAVDFSPVDFVSAGIVALALSGNLATSHLQHPSPVPWDTFGDLLEAAVGPLTRIAYDDWLVALAQRQDAPLYPLLPFLRRTWGREQNTYLDRVATGRRADVSTDRTSTALAHEGITCPAIDVTLLRRYVTAVTRVE